MDIGTSIRSARIRGLRVPGGVVSVEVAQDDGVILDMEESGEGGGVARGGRRSEVGCRCCRCGRERN